MDADNYIGIMYMLAKYITYSTSNMIAFEKLNMPQWEMIPAGTIISLSGMGIGFGLYLLKLRKQNK